jgi:hypothetical protein
METPPAKKLSELIREGAALRPPTRSRFFNMLFDGSGTVCSCALGAAYEAATGHEPKIVKGSMGTYVEEPSFRDVGLALGLAVPQDIKRDPVQNKYDPSVHLTEEQCAVIENLTSVYVGTTPEALVATFSLNDDLYRKHEDTMGDYDPRLVVADAFEAIGL